MAEMSREIERVRRFNRFYTQRIGVVGMRASGVSLAARRVLFEIHRLTAPASVEIARELELDSGYLSRILRDLEKRGWIARERSAEDGRRRQLRLTEAGQRQYEEFTEGANSEVGALLVPLGEESRGRLIAALDSVEEVLKGVDPAAPCRIHEHGPGDLGWVVHRHGVLYARHFGYGERFEAMVFDIAASFAREHDPARERLWIAEVGGEKMGCIMLSQEQPSIARLRLFLVEPRARGRGVGAQLIETCLAFARRRGYQKMVLTTVKEMAPARRLYRRAGFELMDSRPHWDWGKLVHQESWELDLAG